MAEPEVCPSCKHPYRSQVHATKRPSYWMYTGSAHGAIAPSGPTRGRRPIRISWIKRTGQLIRRGRRTWIICAHPWHDEHPHAGRYAKPEPAPPEAYAGVNKHDPKEKAKRAKVKARRHKALQAKGTR
jgi:ribosomal protein L36